MRRFPSSATLALVSLGLVLSCTDGRLPADLDDTGPSATLLIAPSFPPVASRLDAAPIVLIEARVLEVGSNLLVTDESFDVDPNASEWQISLRVPLSGGDRDVLVEVELLNAAGQTEWSTRVGPLTVRLGPATQVSDVDLARGPLTNLTVTSLSLSGPASVIEGSTFTMSASAQTSDGSSPTIFFTSLDPEIATIDDEGDGLAITPGTARIEAAAGSQTASATVLVLPEPLPDLVASSVEVSPVEPDSDDLLDVHGLIENTGDADAGPFEWQISVDGSPIASGSESSLAVGASVSVEAVQVGPFEAGDRLFELSVDVQSAVRESDEDDNQIGTTVTIMEPPAGTGGLAGRVISGLTGEPEVGVTVLVEGPTSVQLLTDSDGRYEVTGLPLGLYDITVMLVEYVTTTLFDAEVFPDVVTTVESIQLVPDVTSPGAFFGTVIDASTTNPVPGATLELRSGINATAGSPIASTSTGSDGAFSFSGLNAGSYTLMATASGFVSGSRTVVVIGGTSVTGQDVVLSSTNGGSGELVRVVLTWGATPSDLDAHLTGPDGTGRFHVYFGNRGSLLFSPIAQLDVDQVSGFGPETITFDGSPPGVFRYSVHDFTNRLSTNSDALGRSGARVEVFQGANLLRRFFVPSGQGTLWTVFEYSGGEITVIDALSFESDSNAITVSGHDDSGAIRKDVEGKTKTINQPTR